ncbi:unnamed protein product [Sphagnum jensenii]|uniref:Uncharacterized protein n=1 Tax=Sphagnum jensenii TaxID=128206 RepID=A0ABP1A6Z9_9BRYO
MSKSLKPPASLKSQTQLEAKQPTVEGLTPNAKFHCGIPRLTGAQTQTSEANANPFASLGERNREAEPHERLHVEAMEGWSFQGKRRHTPKLASPKQDTTQLPFHTPQWEATPGGNRGLMHLEVHPSFFTSLGISASPNNEPFRTRIWPVLVREKNSQKETLVHSKNQALPHLPLSIKIMGLAEATEEKWSPSSAWADLIQRIEL